MNLNDHVVYRCLRRGRSTSVIPAVPAASSVTAIGFIRHLQCSPVGRPGSNGEHHTTLARCPHSVKRQMTRRMAIRVFECVTGKSVKSATPRTSRCDGLVVVCARRECRYATGRESAVGRKVRRDQINAGARPLALDSPRVV